MIVTAVLSLLGLGFAAAVILAIASKFLAVKEDPRIAAIEAVLPGANCGGCGYAGCAGAAAAVVGGKAPVSVCVAGGNATAEAVAAVMGAKVDFQEPRVAELGCEGGDRAESAYHYEGARDCRAQAMLYGGARTCGAGCLGLGSCVRACPFDAIHMGPEGIPVVDADKCRACGKCAEACPRGVISILGLTNRLTHLNELGECLAPCRQKCPAQIDVPRYVQNIREGDYAGAVNTIRERNPLLLVCGRVCPHPCEDFCRRGNVDEPVAINMLKRFVADWEMERGERLPVERLPDTGRRVAVVGGGPAGLSCAFFLRRLGHSPVIFESMPKLGGQLRYGIPEYRLPKKVLDWEIQGILDMGIEARVNARFGRDYTLESLRAEGFEAFFLGIGAWEAVGLGVPGQEAPGVMGGIEFLAQVGLGAKVELGKRVVVVGGGNTAIDAARTSVRLGSDVTIMYRRTKSEMPANQLEIHGAEEEGVKFQFLAAPTRVVADDSGHVTGLEYVTMRLGEPDASGRRRPEAVPGSETVLPCDTIIAAIGQKADIGCLYDDSGTCPLETTKWKTIAANPDTLQTIIPDVFTGGDVFTGPSLVVTAVGAGRRAARFIHDYLSGREVAAPANLQTMPIAETLFKTVSGVDLMPRSAMPELTPDERAGSFAEVEKALTEEEAHRESHRCLNCGLVCYNRAIAAHAACQAAPMGGIADLRKEARK